MISPAVVPRLREDFAGRLGPHWSTLLPGQGSLEFTGSSLRLVNAETSARVYTDAQIDDYQRLARRAFLWSPPLRLAVRARFSHPGSPLAQGAGILRGTAGFGFWNDPFLMTGPRVPTLPRAIWFFYASPPSDMKLDLRTPGYGWKAATIDALRWAAFPLALSAPLTVPLMNLRPLYRRLWPAFQRMLRVAEAPVETPMTEWHNYVIEWGSRSARFSVDGNVVLSTDRSPQGPLGLVIWLDNQYLIATPWGRLGYGLLASQDKQWLELESVEIS
jgi:hypothetical protein